MGTEEASRIANAYRCHKQDTIEVFATPYTVRVKRRLTILTVCKLSRFRLSDCIVVCVIDFLASVTIETAFCRSYLQSLPYLILPRKTHFLRRLSLQVKCPISLAQMKEFGRTQSLSVFELSFITTLTLTQLQSRSLSFSPPSILMIQSLLLPTVLGEDVKVSSEELNTMVAW